MLNQWEIYVFVIDRLSVQRLATTPSWYGATLIWSDVELHLSKIQLITRYLQNCINYCLFLKTCSNNFCVAHYRKHILTKFCMSATTVLLVISLVSPFTPRVLPLEQLALQGQSWTPPSVSALENLICLAICRTRCILRG